MIKTQHMKMQMYLLKNSHEICDLNT